MALKKDPWALPKNESWIAVGSKIVPVPYYWEDDARVLPNNPLPKHMPIFIISEVKTTGNGTRMITVFQESDPQVKASHWIADFKRHWRPEPKLVRPRVRKPKPIPPTRFEREEVV